MKPIRLLSLSITLITLFFCNPLWAYGGSSSSSQKACKKPKFTHFTPAHLTTVESGTVFSLHASALTNPKSIVVSVKKQAVNVRIVKKNNGYKISGNLPHTLQNTYARINIKGTGSNNCKASDGWLLKIKADT